MPHGNLINLAPVHGLQPARIRDEHLDLFYTALHLGQRPSDPHI